MTAVRIVLLIVGVAGAIARPRRVPAWVAPVVCAALDLAVGGITVSGARGALHPLAEPIAFLLAAVPMAVLLDRLGFFAALARLISRPGRGTGGLWVLAALVTTALNLDAAVVLLTPLYVTIARRSGRSPVALAFQPVLLACLASSALPVSNLTNLIAASWTGASAVAFLTHLALPSVVATAVGWWCYRRVFDTSRGDPAEAAVEAEAGAGADVGVETDDTQSTPGTPGTPGTPSTPGTPGTPSTPGTHGTHGTPAANRALAIGGAVVVCVLVGFVAGRSVGVAPWAVALAADVVLVAVTRTLPWPAIPWGTALIAGSLGVLAAAAVAHLAVGRVVGGHGTLALARTVAASGAAANVVNNLPALLVALPAVGHRAGPTLWAVLLGVNMGPVLLVTGSLSSLLWLDAVGRLGVPVTARQFSWVGLRVGLPAAVAGGTVLLLLLRAW